MINIFYNGHNFVPITSTIQNEYGMEFEHKNNKAILNKSYEYYYCQVCNLYFADGGHILPYTSKDLIFWNRAENLKCNEYIIKEIIE